MNKYKRTWENLGERDAYYAVATHDQFLSENLTSDSLQEFYETGRVYLDKLWQDFQHYFGEVPRPKKALDYGCGAGRVLRSLAEDSEHAFGVDITEAMLEKTKKAFADRGLSNLTLFSPEAFLSTKETFDFVHSVIAIQHIEPGDGMKILEKMLSSLENDGYGMIHLTYKREIPAIRRAQAAIYNKVPALPAMIAKFRSSPRLWAPIYEYDLNEVFALFQRSGCNRLAVRFSDHGILGTLIFFQKTGTVDY